MGATYTRQSTYADGDTITAAHTNDEFDQLLAAFASSSGHTHDGTAAEGGPITKLLGNTLTFGAATSGTDITITFDGESNDGVLKWMEDEDYFEFSDDILVASTEKLQFRDTAIYINSSTDGQLDLVADTEIQIAATTIDINGNVEISGDLTVSGDDITMGTNTSGHIMVADGTNFNPVAISGDVSIAANGAVTIASTAVETSMIAADAITEAKIADNAVENEHINDNVISGQTALTSGLATTDELLISDGGTIKRMDVSLILDTSSADATALAIALG